MAYPAKIAIFCWITNAYASKKFLVSNMSKNAQAIISMIRLIRFAIRLHHVQVHQQGRLHSYIPTFGNALHGGIDASRRLTD